MGAQIWKHVASNPPYFDVELHPFGKGALTADGIQYSAEKTTSTDVYEAVETVTIYIPDGYALEEIYYDLLKAIKSSGASESVLWKWQASDAGVSWEDLFAEVTRAADASAYAIVERSGRFAPTGNFLGTSASFQLRSVIKSGAAAGENAVGKTHNASIVSLKFRRQ